MEGARGVSVYVYIHILWGGIGWEGVLIEQLIWELDGHTHFHLDHLIPPFSYGIFFFPPLILSHSQLPKIKKISHLFSPIFPLFGFQQKKKIKANKEEERRKKKKKKIRSTINSYLSLFSSTEKACPQLPLGFPFSFFLLSNFLDWIHETQKMKKK